MTWMYRVLAALVLLLLSASPVATPGAVSAAVTPTITAIAPATGTAAGGTAVTITGTGFLPGAAVFLNTTPATSVVVVSPTQITAVTPTGIQGAANVRVVNSDGGAEIANALYFYTANTAALGLTSVVPSTGPTLGDTLVTITGSGFAPGATVLMGGVPATQVQWIGSSQLWARTAPNAAGAVTLSVVNPDGGSASLANAFTYTGGVTLTTISPSGGLTSGGSGVTLTGTGFVPGATVRFGATSAANVIFLNSTQLRATTPASAAGTVSVTVTNPNGTSRTLDNGFTFGAPGTGTSTLATVAPASGPTAGGTTVTLTGTGFTGGSTVLFGGAASPNVTFLSSGQLFAVTPANNPGPVAITVINSSGGAGTLNNAFAYEGAPGLTISSVTPNLGPPSGGNTVTINGNGFAPGTTVTFGGVLAASATLVGSSQIVAIAPSAGAGTVAIAVTNTGGLTATLASAYTFGTGTGGQSGPVIVTGISPNSGATAGGTQVTISGSGFQNGASVLFGATPAAGVTLLGNAQIAATAPSGATGTSPTVTVVNPGGTTGSLAGAFTYGAAGPPTPTPPTGPAPAAINLPSRGFGLFVFAGGTSEQLLTASGCPAATAAFYATTPAGEFVVYVPGTSIAVVNSAWRALFPGALPANTALIGKCA